MVFKGTASRSADDVNREFDEMGAHYNAFTNEENTVFYAAVLPEHQTWAVDLLADILRPSLREDDFRMEKKVILEEIQMYDDQPPFGADDKGRALFYGSHPLGQSVLGTAESIRDLSAEAMLAYFRQRYAPGNIVLAATGQIDFPALIAAAERYCGHWEPIATTRNMMPANGQCGFHLLRRENASQQYTLQLASGPAAEDDDRFTAKLLSVILGDDSGSRLYWDLIDTGLAENAATSHCEHAGTGLMMTYLSCEPEQTATNLQRIHDIYRKTENEGITQAELEQAKSKVCSRLVLSSERPRGRLFVLGNDWVYRREYLPIKTELDIVADIDLDDLAAVLKKYPLTRSTTVTIGPLAEVAEPR
jgi:predicted Zn-dependent peptidase